MATVRWKDKTDIATLAGGDRMPVTDVDDTNTDKYFTPDEMETFIGGALVLTGAMACADQTVGRALLKDYGEEVVAKGNLGATPAFDMSAGNVQTGTVDQTITSMTITNETASGDACSLTLLLTNGGAFSVTWDTAIDWPSGIAPTLTVSGLDILTFVTIDAGTIWHGQLAALGSA